MSTAKTGADTLQRTGARDVRDVDVEALSAELRGRIRGEVRFDTASRGLYARDSSNYRQIPVGLVIPRDADDATEAVRICERYQVPLVSRGAGTSLAGQGCNVAVVLDFSKYMRHVCEIHADEKAALVEPGTPLDDLRDRAARDMLTFGPDPSTHLYCSLGGMIGNNSCGVRSVYAGRTVDNVEELDIVTCDGVRMTVGPTSDAEVERIIHEGGRRGDIYRRLRELRDRYADLIRERFPKIPRRVSGYCLDELLPENGFHVARSLVGSEGTCVVVLGAKVRLVHYYSCRALMVVPFPDVYVAADHVPEVLELGPTGLEGMDDRLVDYMRKKHMHEDDLQLLPEGGGWLVVEFGGDTQEEANKKAEEATAELRGSLEGDIDIRVYDEQEQQEKIWEIREAGLPATAYVPSEHDTWPGWEDTAVPPERLGDYLRDVRKLLEKHGYGCSFYGHFGQGLLHTRIDFELRTAEGLANYRAFSEEISDLVVAYGGSLTGEHGDGQARAEFLEKLYGSELMEAFREFKSIWDPDWRMNPGKVVQPNRLDENLVLGSDYHPLTVQTHFSFPEDDGDFAHAANRCVGVGKCRRTDSGTMCPSYMVTREEMHTTRGRARLLYEMLQGDVVKDGWQSEEVKEALDLCLACKGCKGDCPVNVDMATYKAEFLSHYYEKKWRPRQAWSMGLIDVWARLAARMPGLVNWSATTPGLSRLVKWLGGIDPQREMPQFAKQTFKSWFFERGASSGNGREVILWADTFNNHLHPGILKSTVDVLENAGCRVAVPRVHLCCGRPLYDYGLLDRAKTYLRRVIDELRPQIEAGAPLIGVEPSCLAVFRDELPNLFPHDEDARRLARQSYLLAEFLNRHAEDYEPPALERKAVVHGHCHQKAIIGMADDLELLRRMGVDYELLDSGCCGMAGSFGFEEGHYDISVACGERVLLPAVRNADENTLVIADGFSCHEQIAQLTGRRPLHLAQVIQMGHH